MSGGWSILGATWATGRLHAGIWLSFEGPKITTNFPLGNRFCLGFLIVYHGWECCRKENGELSGALVGF